MTRNAWIIFSIICLSLLGGLIYISQRNKAEVGNIDASKIQPASSASGGIADRVFGKADSKVVLIEYGDYQCPGCASAYSTIKEISEKYKDKMAFVFRNFPLTTIHPNALAAASAVESAGQQGKFWEMHDRVYANQNSWKNLSGQARTDYFKDMIGTIGLDSKKWLNDIDSEAVQKKISFDQALGKKIGVSGTPAFYLNGENVGDKYYKGDKLVSQETEGAQPAWGNTEMFDKLVIQPALKKANIPIN